MFTITPSVAFSGLAGFLAPSLREEAIRLHEVYTRDVPVAFIQEERGTADAECMLTIVERGADILRVSVQLGDEEERPILSSRGSSCAIRFRPAGPHI